MTVSVTLFGDLRKYVSRESPEVQTVSLAEDSTVADLLSLVGVSAEEEVTPGVNGEPAGRGAGRSARGREPGERFYRQSGGGRGVIAHYLLKDVPKGAAPLGPENVLVFAPGVLTGVPVP